MPASADSGGLLKWPPWWCSPPTSRTSPPSPPAPSPALPLLLRVSPPPRPPAGRPTPGLTDGDVGDSDREHGPLLPPTPPRSPRSPRLPRLPLLWMLVLVVCVQVHIPLCSRYIHTHAGCSQADPEARTPVDAGVGVAAYVLACAARCTARGRGQRQAPCTAAAVAHTAPPR